MQTQLIGIDAQPIFAALPREQASVLLDALLDALCRGMQSPLPIARKTAFAWLKAAGGDKDPLKAAALCYEGSDFGGIGESVQDPCLARAWPKFDDMRAAGFETWLSLYEPLVKAILPSGDSA